jgi:hypothetical protein
MSRGIITTVILFISLFSNGQTQTEFCESFTNNVRTGNINFKKSYVNHSNNCFIQVMYVEELALDSSNNYLVMKEESKDPAYIETLTKLTLKSYGTNGVSNALIKNNFSKFKIVLVYKDNSKLKSSEYNIKTGNKIIELKKKKEKNEIYLNEIPQEKLIIFKYYDIEYGAIRGDIICLFEGTNIKVFFDIKDYEKKGELFMEGHLIKKNKDEWIIKTKANDGSGNDDIPITIDIKKRTLYYY